MSRKKLYQVETTRVAIQIDLDLYKTIQEIAHKKNWSESYTCYVLLQQAVKEKTRKSKSAKESHS